MYVRTISYVPSILTRWRSLYRHRRHQSRCVCPMATFGDILTDIGSATPGVVVRRSDRMDAGFRGRLPRATIVDSVLCQMPRMARMERILFYEWDDDCKRHFQVTRKDNIM